MNSKRILIWVSFVVVIGLIVWGLIAAEIKSSRKESNGLPPDKILETDHIRGDFNAPVTLLEYGDFQCPACAIYYPIIERLIADVGSSTLRFVFRHFPLGLHANSMPAAYAGESAEEQGKFWEMYGLLYERQTAWESSSDPKSIFVGYAKELGLNEEKFLADFGTEKAKNRIDADRIGGTKAGVNSTPTFFINGKQIKDIRSYDEFKKIINDAVPKISF